MTQLIGWSVIFITLPQQTSLISLSVLSAHFFKPGTIYCIFEASRSRKCQRNINIMTMEILIRPSDHLVQCTYNVAYIYEESLKLSTGILN